MKYFAVIFLAIFIFQHSVDAAVTEAPDDDDDWEDTSSGPAVSGGPQEADDDGRVYKNPRNSPSAVCPRDEEQATLLGQKCLRKCSSDEDCKSKKKKCLCDGACGMSCIKPDRECPELDKPELGDVTVSGRLFGDKAVYSCPHGYHVVGLQSRNCQADGQWAGQAPACKQNIYCLTPPHIEHARHSALPEQATFDLDATIQYHCHTGYVTNGFPRAKCLAIEGHASWYGPDITCEPRSCGPPGELPHGWVTAECHTFGCRAALHCGAGFELVGRAERFCQSDGTWAPNELPTCVLVTAVQCPTPDAPRHGRAIYTSCAYNSIVSYECKYGYRLVGDNTRRCGADKKWSGTQPVCKEINCGHPGRLYNGWLENIEAGTGLGASIIFRCHDGMRMEGNSSTVCQLDGTWRYPLPRCLAPCVVPHVTQGKVILVPSNITQDTNDTTPTSAPTTQIIGSSTMVHHGDALIVECEKNYEFPSNTPAVTCNNGTWTQILKCQPARCKRLPKPPKNGMVIAPKTDHGMRARFHCKDGFALKGPEMLLCSFGNWTGEMPICQEVYCPFPGYIENGKVLLVGNMGLYDYRPYVKKVVNNKQIMYDCDKGYVLSEGPPGATCIGGHWSPKELPSCTPGQHPRLRWSRRRRSAEMSKRRYLRSKYLRKYYHHLRKRSIDITDHQNLLKIYDLYDSLDQFSPQRSMDVVQTNTNDNTFVYQNRGKYNFDDLRNVLGNHFRRKRQTESFINKPNEWSQYNRLYRSLRKRSLDYRRPYYANSRKYQGYNFFGLRPRAKRDTRNRHLKTEYFESEHINSINHNYLKKRSIDILPLNRVDDDFIDILPLHNDIHVRSKRFIDNLPIMEQEHDKHRINKRSSGVSPQNTVENDHFIEKRSIDILPVYDYEKTEHVLKKRFLDILPLTNQFISHKIGKRHINILPENGNDEYNIFLIKRSIDILPLTSNFISHKIGKRSIDDQKDLSKRSIDILPDVGNMQDDYKLNKRNIDILPLHDDGNSFIDILPHRGDNFDRVKRSIDFLPLNSNQNNDVHLKYYSRNKRFIDVLPFADNSDAQGHKANKISIDILPFAGDSVSQKHNINKRFIDVLPFVGNSYDQDHNVNKRSIDILPVVESEHMLNKRSPDILPLHDGGNSFIDVLPQRGDNFDRVKRSIDILPLNSNKNNGDHLKYYSRNKRFIDILPFPDNSDAQDHKVNKRSIDILPFASNSVSQNHNINKRFIDILPFVGNSDANDHNVNKRSIDILPLDNNGNNFVDVLPQRGDNFDRVKRAIDILPLNSNQNNDEHLKYYSRNKRFIDILPFVGNSDAQDHSVNKRSIDILPFDLQWDKTSRNLYKRSTKIKQFQTVNEGIHNMSKRNIDILPFRHESGSEFPSHSVAKRFIDILPLNGITIDKKVTKRSVNGIRNSYLARKYEELKKQWEEEMAIRKKDKATKTAKNGNFQENPPLKVDPKGGKRNDKNKGKFKDLPKITSEELIKRMKRTSRKTERLNQTTASVPKSNKENKNRQMAPSPGTPNSGVTPASADVDGTSVGNGEERGKGRGRVKGPCDPVSSEPYVNVEVVKYGRDPNITYSSGTIVRVACGKGYGLNLGYNSTAKCVRGRWKPMKPICEILPCHIPVTDNGIFTLSATEGGQLDTDTPLNETVDIENGQVVQFACEPGFNVQGASNLRCWHGDWAVTSMPECVPAPCELPVVSHGVYSAGYRPGLTTAHGSAITLHCERGYAPPAVLQCSLGEIRVRPPEPCQSIEGNISSIREGQDFRGGSDIVSEDFDELEYPTSASSTECGPPARVLGTLIYRDGAPTSTSNSAQRYPHGTEVTFRCIAAIMGERSTWKILCDKGKWVGKSVSCDEEDMIPAGLLTNATCTFRNNEPNVVSFYNDLEIKEEVVEFPAGAVLVSRCVDIGKYAMIGPNQRKCMGGEWDGSKPSCFGLNQENDYAMEKPPTILFRHQLGPIMQSNDGKLIVYPGTILHMECLWMRKFGNPKWNVSHEYRKYPEGWSSDPGRDSYLEFRLSIFHAVQDDSGIFTCITPARQSHQVEIVVEAVHCPPLPIRRGLISSSQSTKMGSEVSFSCANGNSLIGAAKITCLPSGNWSSPLPLCESVECGEVVVGSSGPPNSRPRVSIVSRGVGGRAAFSCPSGWGLRGPPETVCSPSGEWIPAPPTCVEVSCPPPAAPVNGYLLGKAPFRAGDVVQFNCNPAHMMQGQPIVACQDNARWSGETPKCIQACSYPGTTISGRMSSVKFYYKIGETISFTCEPGLILRGAPMLRCLRNGKWSNAIPICSRESSGNETFISGNDSDQLLNDAPILSEYTSTATSVVDHSAHSLTRKSDTMTSFAGVSTNVSSPLLRSTQLETTKKPQSRPKLTKSKTYFKFNQSLLASLSTLPTIIEVTEELTHSTSDGGKVTHAHTDYTHIATEPNVFSTEKETHSSSDNRRKVTPLSTDDINKVTQSSVHVSDAATHSSVGNVDVTYPVSEHTSSITAATYLTTDNTDKYSYPSPSTSKVTSAEKVTYPTRDAVKSTESSSVPIKSTAVFKKVVTQTTPTYIDDWYSTANNYYFTSTTKKTKAKLRHTTPKPKVKNCTEVEEKSVDIDLENETNVDYDLNKNVDSIKTMNTPLIISNLKIIKPSVSSATATSETPYKPLTFEEVNVTEVNSLVQEYELLSTQPSPSDTRKNKKKVSLDLLSLFEEIDKLENKHNNSIYGMGTSKKKDLSHIQQATNAEIEHIKKQLGIETNSKRKLRNR